MRARAVAAAFALMLGATAATSAPVTFIVTAGSASGDTTVAWTAPAVADSDPVRPDGEFVHFRNETRHIDLTCERGTAAGAVTTGPAQAGTGLAQISDMTWQDCFGLTLEWGFTPRNLPWGVTVNSELDGVVTGEITGVRIVQADVSTGGSQCHFELLGPLPFTYTNATQLLEVSGASLTMDNVGGSLCPLVMGDGDEASLDMTFQVEADNPAENPIAITQD